MEFSDALRQAIEFRRRIYRPSWNGNIGSEEPRQFVQAQFPDAHSKMNNPYLYITQSNGATPWVPSQGDLFATDWRCLDLE
jgi:hypothetical protein